MPDDVFRIAGEEGLTRHGLSLRLETPEDAPFLAALFASVRGPEFEGNGWPDAVRSAFLADQFRFQVAHYARFYADADFLIVQRQGFPIGRLYLHRGPGDHRIVDISLLPELRNQGIGGALLDMACAEASRLGRVVSLHVEKNNPAQRLYRRKGFTPAGENGPYWLMIRAPAQDMPAEAKG
ncbi:GNAT family N-acetyltransferase [Ancylobacter rudongensis]|uniref:Ribosomal protein S18 acetylase RimI n=1 Tax=Ancylobacter rudongensis TaxID=177413 RepID=A0A1G4QL83_9HYPH|nr:GNAT family N-acetyltransferase [Ancylobacter rudongensis]SCW45386.1 Ribosomal protein S18 acetylase RimI [Ancylobacter rudongensis]